MRETSLIEIDPAAVARNMRTVGGLVGPGCSLCPIIKADAYGLGAARIAPLLVAAGARMLAVYTPEQAAEIVEATGSTDLFVLMPVRDLDWPPVLRPAVREGRLHLTIHDAEQLTATQRAGEHADLPLPVHLEVDTGMSRGGCGPDEALVLLQRIASAPGLRLAGIFTHFASAERNAALTERQLAAFDRLLAEGAAWIGPDCLVHAANSFALLRHARYHKLMVRFGLAWAGYGPEWMERGTLAEGVRLEPAVRWSSHVVHVKTIEPGTTVGYGATWTARRRSRIGLVPVGYADGYPGALGGRDEAPGPDIVGVCVDGPSGRATAFVPVVGAVNMDQITIDLTGLPAAGAGVPVGTTVELISPRRDAPNHLPAFAAAAGMIPHEVLCRLHPRLRRTCRSGATSPERPLVSIAQAVRGPDAATSESPGRGPRAGAGVGQ